MNKNTSSIPFILVDTEEQSNAEKDFNSRFGARVIGQPGALQVAGMAYSTYKNPLRDKTRPIGIYYLVGPSRTGKSLTAEALAELFHGDREALIRIQASDYEEKHQILDIKGAPPTYIGYRDRYDPKNRLEPDEADPASIVSTHNLKRVRRGSKSKVNIVVIEEFEKSSYDFYKLWMGVFDKGKLQLGNGEVVDFTNTIFILTSNLATDELEKMAEGGFGFGQKAKVITEDDVKTVVGRAMKLRYRREFRNRIDAVVIFKPLTGLDMTNIVDAEIKQISERIFLETSSNTYFELQVEESAKSFLLAACGTEVAELKRVIARELLMPLGRLLDMDNRRIHGGDIVQVFHDGKSEKLSFAIAAGAMADEKEATVKQQKLGFKDDSSDDPTRPPWVPQREAWDDEDDKRPPVRPHQGVFITEAPDFLEWDQSGG